MPSAGFGFAGHPGGWHGGCKARGEDRGASRGRTGTIASNLNITLEPIVEADTVALLWLDLEGRSDPSFFQSWGWIRCWLRALPREARPCLFAASDDGRPVVLAVLVPARHVRHRVFSSNGLYLNETGDPSLDQLTVEYNGFLVDAKADATVLQQCIAWLVGRRGVWDELFLSGLGPDARNTMEAIGPTLGLRAFVRDRKPSAYVDLDEVRRGGADYLTTLSSNTRYQIRRSLRLYGADGKPSLRIAATMEEALAFFAELKRLHQAYWMTRGHPGSFAGPFFETFHAGLLRDRFDRGEIQLAKIAAGERVIGYLYNFAYRKHIYAYQSGFQYEADAKFKPGLVSHYLAIEHNLTSGASIYDFLAGEGQHKQSLGTAATEMTWLVLQRSLAKFRIEDALRSLKRRFVRG